LAEIESNNHVQPLKIGVAHDLQISEDEIAVESFDIPMDWVVTQSRLFGRESGPHSDVLSERKSS
jgi:5-formyltetrahydrofolate cyclo-ligase